MPVFALTEDLVFPPPHLARRDGLLAVGGDLRVERLQTAYRMGIFPWYGEGEPILWWSPDPRLVLLPGEFTLPRRFARTLGKHPFTVTFDTAFDAVIHGCADSRVRKQPGTWIVPEMMRAYSNLHAEGSAHSVETWQAGRLVGGLYGVSMGTCFFGESMFSRVTNASKVALAALVAFLRKHDFSLIDCQVTTRHLLQFGAREIPRRRFLKMLAAALAAPAPTDRCNWSAHPGEPLTKGGIPK